MGSIVFLRNGFYFSWFREVTARDSLGLVFDFSITGMVKRFVSLLDIVWSGMGFESFLDNFEISSLDVA
jgi:hypothetical protein